MPRGIVALVFLAHVVAGSALEATDEVARLAWLSADDIAARCDEAYAVRVLDALHNGEPAIRAHDGVTVRRDLAALPN